MPRGHVTPAPEGWLPLKTPYGWTAVRLRGNGGVTGCDMPRTADGKYVAFWRTWKEAAESLAGWAILAKNEALEKENARLQRLVNSMRPSIPSEGLSEDISS